MDHEMTQHAEPMNLASTTHRRHESVWDKPGWDGAGDRMVTVRILTGIGGTLLTVQGLRQRGWPGRLLVGAGTSLTWWAITGGGKIGQAQRWVGELAERTGFRRRDAVQEASDESFPASDAPAWTPTMASGARREPARRQH